MVVSKSPEPPRINPENYRTVFDLIAERTARGEEAWPRWAALDAVAMPASRAVGGSWSWQLSFSAAHLFNRPLFVPCSRRASPAALVKQMDDPRHPLAGVAVRIPPGYRHQLITGYATHDFPEAIYGREENDLSDKVNVLLTAGFRAGIRTVFRADDDVSKSVEGIRECLTWALAGEPIVGLTFSPSAGTLPDNSRFRDAQRLSGVEPGVSIPGANGFLNVQITAGRSLEPNVYNSDHFLMRGVNRRYITDAIRVPDGWVTPPSSGHATGYGHQIQFHRFADPKAAASEEWGDLIGEGMRTLELRGVNCMEATQDDWADLIAGREHERRTIIAALEPRADDRTVRAALRCLHAGGELLDEFKPERCVAWMRAFAADLDLVRDRAVDPSDPVPLPYALRELNLAGTYSKAASAPGYWEKVGQWKNAAE
jgi:hypothetical protein